MKIAPAHRLRSLTGVITSLRGRQTAGPQPSIDSGRTVSAGLLHLLLVVCGVGAYLVAAAGEAETGLTVVVCLAIVGTCAASLRRPGYGPLAVSLIPTTVALVAVAPVGYSWRVPLLMIAVHALVRLSWFTAQVTARTRIELTVLRAEGRRFLIVNLIGQSAALLAGALTLATADGDHAPGLTWLAVVGAAVLVALVVTLRSGARAWPWHEAPPAR